MGIKPYTICATLTSLLMWTNAVEQFLKVDMPVTKCKR